MPALADDAQARVLYSQAIERYAATDFDGAIGLLQQALVANKEHWDSQHMLGVVLLQTRRYPQAEEALRVVVGRASFKQLFFELGLSQYHQRASQPQKLKDAEGTFIQAVTSEPQRAAAHYMLGMTLYDLHDYARAAESFQKAAQLSRMESDAERTLRVAAYYYRGESLLRAGNDTDGRRAFASVLRDGPNTVFADYARRGGTLQGDSGEAAAYAAVGVQYDSNPVLAGEPAGKVDSGRAFFDGGVRYMTPVAGPVDLGAGLAFFQSIHFSEPGRSVDLTAPQGNIELGFRFSDKPVQDRLSFGYTGGADFYQGFTSPTKKAFNFFAAYHRPYARFDWRQDEQWYGSIGYTFRFEDFNSRIDPPPSGSVAANDRRSFLGHEARLGEYYLFPKRWGRAGLGGFFRLDDAKGAYWDNVGGGGFLEGELTPHPTVALRLLGGFSYLSYGSDTRSPGRGDASVNGQFSVRYWFIQHLGVHGDVGVQRQFSPLAAFDFTRFTASFYLMARL